jgi:Asp/Glu/hydantoin racemase
VTARRIALIHGTPAAIVPAVAALAANFPEAEAWNLLDDKLLTDADAHGGLTPELRERMNRLIAHALAGGAAGVLLTCSMYGAVAQATHATVPVLAPDEAAFAAVAAGGYDRVLLVTSFASALDDAEKRLNDFLAGTSTRVVGAVVPAALAATKAGDDDASASSSASSIEPRRGSVDAVILGQYSLAPAAAALSARLELPVIAGPRAAAIALRAAVFGAAADS